MKKLIKKIMQTEEGKKKENQNKTKKNDNTCGFRF